MNTADELRAQANKIEEQQEYIERLRYKLQSVTAEQVCCNQPDVYEDGQQSCCGNPDFTWPHDVVALLSETPAQSLEASGYLVMRNPPRLGVGTLCRLMDDCLPDQIDDERDMQRLIDKLWPALCCEFELSKD